MKLPDTNKTPDPAADIRLLLIVASTFTFIMGGVGVLALVRDLTATPGVSIVSVVLDVFLIAMGFYLMARCLVAGARYDAMFARERARKRKWAEQRKQWEAVRDHD